MRDDDIRAFLVGDYARVVRAVAAVCGDRSRAEDAVQDAVVDAWTSSRSIDDVAGWVTTVALNRARSRWRSVAAEQRAFARLARRGESSSIASSPTSALDERLAVALGELPRNQRIAVALHYLLDLSVVEVARQLGVAEGTAKVHLHRGRNALREALGVQSADEGIDRVQR